MMTIRCEQCGATIRYRPGDLYGECPACGTIRTVPQGPEEDAPEEVQEPVPETKRPRRRLRGPRLSNLQWGVICACSVLLLFAFVFCLVSGARLGDEQDAQAALKQAYERKVYRTTVKYRSLIEKYADAYGLRPSFLAAIILNESSYDPNAYVPSTEARGLMQLIPSAAKTYVKGTAYAGKTFTDDDLYDPELNICIGANYVRVLSERFGGDPVLIACAYHAGPNNVDYWLYRYSADHRTLRLAEIPMADTRKYAEKVVDSYAIYREHYYPDRSAGAAGADAGDRLRAGTGADLRHVFGRDDLGQNGLSESALGA